MRHEDNHLDEKNEVRTDILAYKGIVAAYTEWQATGDTRKYYFVFKTPEGPVYTTDEEEDILKAA